MIAIENENFIVELNNKGAQIMSFKDKKLAIEYIWIPNNKVVHTSPTLFPIVGKSFDNNYHFTGQETQMPEDGVLKDADFNILINTKKKAVFEFVSNSETLKMYPYYFKLEITYTLIENELTVQYRLLNDGVIVMPFNFGIMPTFNLPLLKNQEASDYKIVLSSPSKLKGLGKKVNNGLVKDIEINDNAETMTYHNINSPYVSFTDGKHGVRISTVGFPIFSIIKPDSNKKPLISFKLSIGMAKQVEKDLAFIDRDAIMELKPGASRIFTYTIKVF